MTKTILFFIADAHGHVNALSSTLRELRRRNNKVIILLQRHCEPGEKLRSQGYQVEILREEVVAEEVHSDAFADSRRFQKGPLQTLHNVTDTILEWYLEFNNRYDEFKMILENLNPDLVVIDHVLMSPYILLSGRPWVRFYSIFPSYLYAKYNKQLVAGLGLKMSEMNPSLRAEVERTFEKFEPVRKFYIEKGAPNWESDDWAIEPVSPYLNFYLGPQELGYENEPGVQPLPDTFVRLEHTIDEPESNAEFEIPEKLSTLPGKLIYFSLGTVASFNVELMNKMTGILSKSPHRFIVSMGVHHEQVKLYPNMWGAVRVDQKAVLSKADLFITHGGHNSAVESFHYGVPRLIVMPVFGDQYDCAMRLEECGFGRLIDPFNFEEQHLLDSIEALLANQQMVERMSSISSRIRPIRYYEIAADKIEELLNKDS